MDSKFKAIGLLVEGMKPADIAKALDMSLSTVLRYQRDFEIAKSNGTLLELLDMDKLAFGEVKDKLVSSVPDGMKQTVETKMGKVSRVLDLMDTFQSDLVGSASVLNTRIKVMALSVESSSELLTLVECVSKLQNAFFNKPVTQVNVQNNLGGESKYGNLLSDKPANH